MSKNVDFDPALYDPTPRAPRKEGGTDTVKPAGRDGEDSGTDTVKPAGRLEEPQSGQG